MKETPVYNNIQLHAPSAAVSLGVQENAGDKGINNTAGFDNVIVTAGDVSGLLTPIRMLLNESVSVTGWRCSSVGSGMR